MPYASIAILRQIVGRYFCPFFDFDRDILTSCAAEMLVFIGVSPILELPVFNQLRDFFGFAYNLVVGGTQLDFSDDDPEMTDLGGIYFAKIICDFNEVKRFDGLGSG